MKGCFYGLSRDVDGNLVVSFRVFDEKNARKELETIKDEKTIDIQAKKVHRKRSLSANAYYWVLVQKIAGVLGVSNNRVHNTLLRRYGALQDVDGEPLICFIPDTEKAFNQAIEAETYHIKPTSAVKIFKDGKPRRMYRIIKGSSEYDSAEMARLINGCVDECKHLGIETLTPWEIAQMLKGLK